MTIWRTFNSINEDLAFGFGLSLNLLLLIVIHKVKVVALKKYNLLLLQCCIIDLIQVVISFLVKPVIVIHKRTLYYLSNGFLRPTGGMIEAVGIEAWLFSVFFCIGSMPVAFVFRYRTVCLRATISKKFYITALIIAALNACIYTSVSWKYHFIENRDMLYLAEEGFAWLMADDEGKVKAASACPAVSFLHLF